MKLLLDTHIFLWLTSEPEKLRAETLTICRDAGTRLLLSVASLWEIQIKSQLGKLSVEQPLSEFITREQVALGLELVSVEPHHIWELAALPPLHRDPFDRLLVAQSRVEGARLLTADPITNTPSMC